jgi:hypothetical protein
VEVLVELTGHASREWMNAAELGRRIGANLPFMKQVLNRLGRAGPRPSETREKWRIPARAQFADVVLERCYPSH